MYEIAIRQDLLPAIRTNLLSTAQDSTIVAPVMPTVTRLPYVEPTILKQPWYKRTPKIVAVKLEDYFVYEENTMITYRIIPHANIAGNNKRLWRSIHKMYEMYDKLNTRIDRKGLKFHYREKDYLWFDVIFRQGNGEKKIEFYVTTSEYQATKLKRRLENKMNATLKESTINHTNIPEENTIIQELKYLRHDIFSLNTSTNDKQTPMASILNTVDELQHDGDIARLSICNEVESRQKWVKNASWAREKLSKGRVPQRTNFSPKKAVPLVKNGIAGLINEINAVLTDTFEAISNSFFKSDKQFKNEKVIGKGYTLEDEINSTKLSGASLEKVNLPVFKMHARVAAHSSDKLTRETIGETLAISVNDIGEDNELHGVKIKADNRRLEVIKELNTYKLSNKTKYDADVNLISTDELSKLSLQMPSRDLQLKYADEMNAKTRVESVIPNVLQHEDNLLLGYAEVKDQSIPVGLPAHEKEDFYCGYTFTGKQGSGKDNAIQNFVFEGSMKHNISFVIPDWICQEGHKGMADGIRDLLPPEKIVDLDLSNEEWIIPMDLTEVITKLGRKGGSRFAMEMVDFLELDGLARSEKFLMEASKAANGSLNNIKRIIEDEDYRLERIEHLVAEGNLRTAKELAGWGSNDELGNKCDAILNRLAMFFGDDTLHDIFSQSPIDDLNFEKWMREGKVIIIRMPARKLGNASKTLAHWVTLKVLMTRFLMSDEDKEKHGCFMIFNEPEQVESQGLAKLMGRVATEGRKERLGSIFAFHHWDKLSKDLQKNLKAGGVNQFLFASDYKPTFEDVKERLSPNFTVEEALATPKHYAIAILNTKEPLPPFMVHMLPPLPDEMRYDNSHLTAQHAKLYGRSWEVLQREL